MSKQEYLPSGTEAHEYEKSNNTLARYQEQVAELVNTAQELPFSAESDAFSVNARDHGINPYALASAIEKTTGLTMNQITEEFLRDKGVYVKATDNTWEASIATFGDPLYGGSENSENARYAVAVLQNNHPEDNNVADKTVAIVIGPNGVSSRTDELSGQRNSSLPLPDDELLGVFDEILGKVQQAVETVRPDDQAS